MYRGWTKLWKQYGNENVLAALKVHELYPLLFFCLFTLCSASANALQIAFSNSQYESNVKWKTCPDFQRGQIVGKHLAGASGTKMTTLLGVSRTAVSKVMIAYTNNGKTSSVKRNSG